MNYFDVKRQWTLAIERERVIKVLHSDDCNVLFMFKRILTRRQKELVSNNSNKREIERIRKRYRKRERVSD